MNLKTCFPHYVSFAVTILQSVLHLIENSNISLPSNQTTLRRRTMLLRGIVDRMLGETDGFENYFVQLLNVEEYMGRLVNGIMHINDPATDIVWVQHTGLSLLHELQRD